MENRIEAKEVLKLAGISRATLTRWMDSAIVADRGYTRPFPSGELRDGKTKVWSLEAVQAWLDENAEALGRHRSDNSVETVKGQTFTMPLWKAISAAECVAEEDGTQFDVMPQIEEIRRQLMRALESKGVAAVKWNGRDFDFSFAPGSEGNHNRVLFVLSYS